MTALVARISDGLRNLVSGLGGSNDKSTSATYALRTMTHQEIEACYRSTWLGRKIHDIPAKDMTREWRSWQAEDDQIEAIENEEKRLQLHTKLRRALVWGKLFGGAALILGLPGDPASPAPAKIGEGQLRYVHVVSRWQLALGERVLDLENDRFGLPETFQLNANQTTAVIHPSRLIPFIGNEVPDDASTIDSFWGDPLLLAVWDALTAHDTGVSAISTLLNEAKVDIIHVPGLMNDLTDAGYEQTLMERFTLAAVLKSLTNALILDGGDGTGNTGETWETREVTWTGLPDVQRMLFQLVSGAADIPATRLIGQSPTGMNATGDSDTRNYYDKLASEQKTDLTPAIAPLDEYVIMSATGQRDPSVYYEWNPLWQMTPTDKATHDKTVADTASVYANMGVVPNEALAAAVQNRLIEDGVFPGLEAAIEEAQAAGAEPDIVAPPAAPPPAANANDPNAPAAPQPGAVPSGNNSNRRAANDRARRYVRDSGQFFRGARELLLTSDMRVDFNPNHDPHSGEFSSGGGSAILFEVSPNPDGPNAAKWKALPDASRQAITDRMANRFAPQVAEQLGVTGNLQKAVGSFEGEINPSRIMVVSSNPLGVAGGIGTVFDQKAMVVMDSVPGDQLTAHGLIAIHLPNASVDTLREVQGKLGSYGSDGWTYSNGRLQMLNFSGTPDADYASSIDRQLGGAYKIEHATAYTAYIESKNYVGRESFSGANNGGTGGGGLSQQFARALDQEIAAAQKVQPGQADHKVVGDFNPYHDPHTGEFTSGGGGGIVALTSDYKRLMASRNEGKSIDQLRTEASANQQRLETLGKQVQSQTGVEFHGPPPDAAIKTVASITRKVRDEGYAGPHELRDISRAMYVVDSPEQADTALQAMAGSGARIYDRGWSTNETGYLGRYAYMEHPNGGVSEIQFVPRGELQIRNTEGHQLYEIYRVPSNPIEERNAAAERSRQLYASAVGQQFSQIYGK